MSVMFIGGWGVFLTAVHHFRQGFHDYDLSQNCIACLPVLSFGVQSHSGVFYMVCLLSHWFLS